MMTREVNVPIWPSAVSSVKAAMFRLPATTTCSRAMPISLTLRRCSAASVNIKSAPSEEVATRMLNGGSSSSTMRSTGQVKPQHRLRPTSMSRADVSAASCGDGAGKGFGRRFCWRCAGGSAPCLIGAGAGDQGPWPQRRLIRSEDCQCCTSGTGVLANRAIFEGLPGAPASSPKIRSPTCISRACAHRPRRCRACGIAQTSALKVARSQGIVSGMAGRYATALFELALEETALDAVRADLDRFDALLGESGDLARLVRSPVFSADEQSKALGAVLAKAAIGGLAAK